MTCHRCAAENPAGARFCMRCGAALVSLCPVCGADNPADSSACATCAARLDGRSASGFAESEPEPPAPAAAGGGLAGEIKQVSVLFCDIVGSTGLTERIGDEAMRDLVGRFLDIATSEVRRYGGVVPQFRGDGFMAVFGAPQSYEDHVRRALLAALAVRRALGGETGAGEQAALELPVRIAVDTGAVVFGPVGGGFATSTIIGDTANIAARLQEAAAPGQILIGENTRHAARGYVRAEPLGPLAIRGRSEPVAAYRLLGVVRSRGARDGLAPARTTAFVNRADETAALLHCVEEAESGSGRLVAIAGEPGIGKSRILAELRQRLAPGRVTWIEGRCLSYGAAIPYLLLLDLLRSNCGIIEAETPETIAHKVRSSLRLAGIDPDEAAPPLLHLLGVKSSDDAMLRPETIKERTFAIFLDLAVRGSRTRPLVLVLEDLHWVDAVSQEFLALLAGEVARAAILILATSRPGYRSPWPAAPYAREIALQPLNRGDSLHVVRSVAGDSALAVPVAEEIVARADGNPLFLEQLALHAGEARDQPGSLTVPATIHDVVMARIDRLSQDAKRLLQTASVIGREFSLRLLRAVWTGTAPVVTGLRELCRLEFLDEFPDDDGTIYVFRHALTRDAAYGSLLERDRRTRHGAVGRALETLYAGRSDEVAELLALHFERSGEAEKAIDYAIAAAEKAQRRWANAEAQGYFEGALHRLDAMPDTAANRLRRIDAVLKQAEVNYALGQYGQHIQALEGVRPAVDEVADPRRRATWHYWAGFLHSVSGGRPDTAIRHCEEAREIASAASLDEIDAFAASCLAQVYIVAGRLHDAIEVGERALAVFEGNGNRWWAGRTLWHLSTAANYLGKWDASLGYVRRGLDHGVALQDLRLKAVGWLRTGLVHIARGEAEAGLACCDQALALQPIPREAAWARAARGYGKIRAGRLEAGIAELSEAFAWFEGSQLNFTRLLFAMWLAEGYLRQNTRRSAEPLIKNALNVSRTTGYFHYEGRACWLMAEFLASEAVASAEDYAETAMRILEHRDAQNDLAKAMITRAALRQRADDAAGARQLLREAGAIFQRLGTRDEPVRVEAALAALSGGLPIPLLGG